MVASDSVYASRAGLEILQAGGNAFDAAAAVSFALAVTRPHSTGLGGGGFLIARLGRDGRTVVLDFRETAPAAAAADMYVQAARRDPDAPPASQYGHLAVAVPGLVAGRVQMLEAYGTKSLAEVIAPAIRLAREGFEVDQHYVKACAEVLGRYRTYPGLVNSCGYVYRVHLRKGDLPEPGETLVQPQLARLLEAIADGGADIFYRGPVAEAIEREMAAHGGILRAGDLAAYRVVTNRRPIESTYRGYELISMPPPSSGGICLAETLNVLEAADLPAIWKRDRSLARHYLIEAMKHAFADRARWLGDSDFASVPVRLLTSKAYARQLARGIDPLRCKDVDTYGAEVIPDDAGTSHFCVVDRWDNCVVSTETINTSFGSLAAVEEWGLILNNEMDDFSAPPGKMNAFGLVQSRRNAVAPGKRPLSSMAPTIVLRDGQPYLLLGGSGGPRIISSVLSVLLGVTDFGLSLSEAVAELRVHHQWRPDEVYLDRSGPPATIEDLSGRGHRVSERRRWGVVQAILIEEGKLIGASDPRKGGVPAGY
jgi:gamma-glutamyltranspeptidase/glutathione hydrolase